MKIIYISKYGSYNPYGMDTRHLYLSRELVRKGHEVTVFLSDSNHQLKQIPTNLHQTVDGVKVVWIKTFKYKKAYGVNRIISWFDFEYKLFKALKVVQKVDVVIVSSLSLLSVFNGIKLKKRFACKLVLEVRDIWPLVLRRISKITRFNPLYRFLAYTEKRGYRHADLIVGTMPNLSSHVQTTIGEEKNVIWIPHLINPNLTYLSHHRYTEELNSFTKRFDKSICYAGSVNRSSSIEILLKCAMKENMNNIGFVVLGDGPILNELKQKYVSPNIIFFDRIPQEEVVAFLKDCDILYDGYLKSESYKFGNSRNKYIEYCLSAKPVLIGYDGFPLFFEDENCGVIVKSESEEALSKGIQLLVNKENSELNKMGDNALRFAQNYLNVKIQTEKLLQMLRL